jgi:GTP pyrophosphokinase
MVLKGLRLEQVHDVRALRIIVPDVAACYQALSLLQRTLPTLPDHCDDYIAHPKRNGYESIHATVLDENGYPCEIQIRTPAMHRIAESGAAAHWRYKAACLRPRERYLGSQPDPSPAAPSRLQTDG